MSAKSSGEMVLHLPTFLDFLAAKLGLDMHHVYFGVELKYFVPLVMSFLVGCVLVGFSMLATRRMEKIPRGSQAFVEIVVEGMYNFLHDILGKHTTRYLPFFGTLFFFILVMNLWGLIPLMTGIKYQTEVSPSMQVYGLGQLGLIHTTVPDADAKLNAAAKTTTDTRTIFFIVFVFWYNGIYER